jgi:hypothetical protein
MIHNLTDRDRWTTRYWIPLLLAGFLWAVLVTIGFMGLRLWAFLWEGF